MNKKELEQFVEKYVAALNSQDVEAIEGFHSADSVSLAIRAMNQKMQKAERRQYHEAYNRAFPDAHMSIEGTVIDAETGRAAFQWRVRGTQKGAFMGLKASGREAEVHGCSVLEIRDGKIYSETSYSDSGALMRQLGHMEAYATRVAREPKAPA